MLEDINGVIDNSRMSALSTSPEEATKEDIIGFIKRIKYCEKWAGTGKYWALMMIMMDLAQDKGFTSDHIEATLRERCCRNCQFHQYDEEIEGTWKYRCFCFQPPVHGLVTMFEFRCAYWQLRDDCKP